jgi:PAS domain S-box-containing protein
MLSIELESGEHFRQIADNLSIVLALSNADLSQFLFVNRAYEKVWGRSIESLYADSFSFVDAVHPDDRDRLKQALQELIKGEPIEAIECRVVRPDGSVRWVLCRGFPVCDSEGRITRLVGSAVDITEPKRAEEKLQRAYSRTESVLQSINDVYILFDRDWRYLYVNQAAIRGIGRPCEEILGRTLWELFPEIVGNEFERHFRHAMYERVVIAFDYYYPSRDTWWENRLYPVPEGLAVFATNITDRKRAAEALRESEDRYRDLVEHSSDLICTHDLDGILLSVNEPPLRILGYSRDELLNKPLRDFVTPEAKPHCDAYLAQIQKDGFAKGLLPVLTKSGEKRLWEFENSLRKNGVNPPIIRGVAHDVTEQKRAEAALRRSEEKFAKAFRSSPAEMLITTLAEGRIVDANETFERNLGYCREELIGRTTLELGLWAEPAQRAAIVEEIRKNGRVVNREIWNRTKSGEMGYKLYSVELIQIGKEPCLLSVSEDITERKRIQENLMRSEAFLAEGQRLSHTGSWSWNPASGEMFWSREMFRIFELDSAPTTPSLELVLQHLHPEDKPVFNQVLERIVREESGSEGDYRIVLPNGSIRHIHCMCRPVFDASGKLLEFVGTAMDITEREKTEAELRRLSGQLLRLHNEERRSIARDLHDTTGQGLVALATTLSQLHSFVPASSRKARKLLSESEALAKECLREVRTLSYVLYPPMLEQAGLEEAIRNFADGFSARTGIQVRMEISPGIGRLSGSVELALFRVMQESLANIQRHSGSHNADILLEHRPGVIVLEVSDSGCGISGKEPLGSGGLPFTIGVGIASMQERIKQVGRRLDIKSGTVGTKVRVTVPVNA